MHVAISRCQAFEGGKGGTKGMRATGAKVESIYNQSRLAEVEGGKLCPPRRKNRKPSYDNPAK